MKISRLIIHLLAFLLMVSCQPTAPSGGNPKKPPQIAVTYSALGSLVQDLAGEKFEVFVLVPNGQDPHEWEASAQDIARLSKASLVVRNGLGLEGGIEKTLEKIEAAGVPFFTASDYLSIRKVKAGEGLPTGDPDQAAGASDPHLWLDPQRMESVVTALAAELKTRFGTDLTDREKDLVTRLRALDGEIQKAATALSPERRLLVTGHESLGYFAERYGFTLVGAIVPSLTTQAEVSASQLSDLKKVIAGRKVRVIFTELGTPPKVAQALASELKIKAVEIVTHALPADGSYFSLVKNLAQTVVENLR